MSKKLSEFYENAISIEAFLERFCGISNINNKRLLHINLKTLFPDLKRVSFEEIIKNPELIYTGKVVFVRDYAKECIPYITNYKIETRNFGLDERETLIKELVSAISKIIKKDTNSLIILENQDSILSNISGSTTQKIEIIADEFVRINNSGSILIKNPIDIYTFEFIINTFLSSNSQYEEYLKNVNNLSREKDIISIRITNNGRVYITFNGITYEQENLLDIRNFLLKSYYPKKEELVSETSDIDLSFLMDYELETLLKKYYKEKNISMFFKIKKELTKRRKEKKEQNRKYRNAKQKIKIKKLEEE